MQVDEDFEETLAHIDELRREIEIKACNKHLSDLIRVYGEPKLMVQPPPYGRLGPCPEPAKFPWRQTLATIS
jgi:hypothetical protein